jgi:hypothetical protein
MNDTPGRAVAAINVAIVLTILIITPTRILQAVQDLSGWLRDQGSFGAFLLFMATGQSRSMLDRAQGLYLNILGHSSILPSSFVRVRFFLNVDRVYLRNVAWSLDRNRWKHVWCRSSFLEYSREFGLSQEQFETRTDCGFRHRRSFFNG